MASAGRGVRAAVRADLALLLVHLAAVLGLATSACTRDPAPGDDAETAAAQGSSTALASASAPPSSPPSSSSPAAVAAPLLSDVATSAAPTTEVARGLWIWELGVNGPPAERAAELAATWGVRRVFLKSGNGATRGRWARNFSAQNRAPFVRRGIEVWAFAYVYGEGVADADGRTWGSVDAQIAAVSETLAGDDVAGLVVDAEMELVGRPDDARRFCAGFRARLGAGQKLAYTSFGWIQRWKDFPFEELDRGCGDAFLPQVYFAHGWPGGAEASLGRMREGIAARGLRAPVWPVQTNMPNPTPATLASFFALAGPDASVFFLHGEDTEQTRRLGAIDWRSQ